MPLVSTCNLSVLSERVFFFPYILRNAPIIVMRPKLLTGVYVWHLKTTPQDLL